MEKYRVYIDNGLAELQPARVSRYPINRNWPGHQRMLDQTKETAFLSFNIKDKKTVRIECDFGIKNVIVRPLSLNIKPTIQDQTVIFEINKPCQVVVEFKDVSEELHFFANEEKKYEFPEENVLYFGKGEHTPGRINLVSGQTVFIDEGAVVYGEIYGIDVEDVKIMGGGILDHSRIKEEVEPDGFIDPPRPSPIKIEYGKNITICGIVIRDSCFLSVRPICCENVHIDNIKIIGNWRYNSDGIDLLNCRHVLVENCFVRSFDDSLCVKGFASAYAGGIHHNDRDYDLSEDIVFRNCVVFNEWGKALEIGIDLCAKRIENCRFENCDVIHATGPVMDVSNVDYAHVSNIVFENIRAEYDEVSFNPMFQKNEGDTYINKDTNYMPPLMCGLVFYSEYYSSKGKRGKISNITFSNISVSSPSLAMPPSAFCGYSEEYGVKNIKIKNLYLNGEKITDMSKANISVGEFAENIVLE